MSDRSRTADLLAIRVEEGDLATVTRTATSLVNRLRAVTAGTWDLCTGAVSDGFQAWATTFDQRILDGYPGSIDPLLSLVAVDAPLAHTFVGELIGLAVNPDHRGAAPRHRLFVPYVVPEAQLHRLDDWYTDEHDAMVLRASEWLSIKRFQPLAGSTAPWNRLVVHDWASADLLDSPYVRESMESEARRSLAENEWFVAGGRRPVDIVAT